MIKVMLIDDDTPFRTQLKALIDWRKHGFAVVGEAIDGNIALSMIPELLPDLLIVDMSMPNMDGAELIEKVSKTWPRIKSIGLSSYDDYNYLRSTMKHGSIDYLLKHKITENNFLQTLKSCAEIIEKEAQDHLKTEKFKSQYEAHKPDLQQKLIRKLLGGETLVDFDKIVDQCLELDLQVAVREGSLILLIIDQFWQFVQNRSTVSEKTLLNSVQAITSEILNEYNSLSFHLGENQFILLLSSGKRHSTMGIIDRQNSVIQRVTSSLRRFLNIEVSMYSGVPYHNITDLINSHTQLQKMAQEHFYDGAGSVRYAAQSKATHSNEPFDSISLNVDIEKSLINAIYQTDESLVTEIIQNYFLELSSQRLSNRSFKIISIELIHLLRRALREVGLISESEQFDPMDAYDRINRFDTMDGLSVWIIAKFIEIIRFIKLSGRDKRHSPVVTKAIHYVMEHISNPISLRDIAESTGVSSSYLSRCFKLETGKGLNEYMTLIRIDHAKKLLREGGLKIKDISLASGFLEYTYFFKVFKQVTGYTPNEYLKKTNIKDD